MTLRILKTSLDAPGLLIAGRLGAYRICSIKSLLYCADVSPQDCLELQTYTVQDRLDPLRRRPIGDEGHRR
jgi:hypothetical protein